MSEPIHVDADTVIQTLRECVAERGEDHVYLAPGEDGPGHSCFYWHHKYNEDGNETGAPGCIIGLMLTKLGVPKDVLDQYEGQTVTEMFRRPHPDLVLTEDAANVARSAQLAQDYGDPWGEALEKAEEAYEDLQPQIEGKEGTTDE